MRAMETIPTASLNVSEGQGKARDRRIRRQQHDGVVSLCLSELHDWKARPHFYTVGVTLRWPRQGLLSDKRVGHHAADISWWRDDRDQRPKPLDLRSRGNMNGPELDAAKVGLMSTLRRGRCGSILAAILL